MCRDDVLVDLFLSYPWTQYNGYQLFLTGVRVPWENEELKLLKDAFLNTDRPPTFDAIRFVQEKCPKLKDRTLAQIKSRAWAIVMQAKKHTL